MRGLAKRDDLRSCSAKGLCQIYHLSLVPTTDNRNRNANDSDKCEDDGNEDD